MLFLAALALMPTGCKQELPFPELHPLQGTISRDGTPMKGGGIIFIPESANPTGLIVNASVENDGTFTGTSSLSTGTGAVLKPGVPTGRFKAVFHPLSDGSVTGLETNIDEVFEFKPGMNTIRIELKVKQPIGAGVPRDDANVPAKPVEGSEPKKD